MLKRKYVENWRNDVFNSPKCFNYRIYKSQHELENFFYNLSDKNIKAFVNYRMCNNCLPVETGRWIGLERNLRKCNLCNTDDIGDEFHYMFKCPFFSSERRKYLGFSNNTNAIVLDFQNIMSEQDTSQLTKLCIYVSIVMKQFRRPPG